MANLNEAFNENTVFDDSCNLCLDEQGKGYSVYTNHRCFRHKRVFLKNGVFIKPNGVFPNGVFNNDCNFCSRELGYNSQTTRPYFCSRHSCNFCLKERGANYTVNTMSHTCFRHKQ